MPKNNKGRKPKVVSKSAAIEAAESQVSDLLEVSPGRWCYHVWSEPQNAWLPADRTHDYDEANRRRTGTVAAMAANALVSNGSGQSDTDLAWRIIGLAYDADNATGVEAAVDRILDALS